MLILASQSPRRQEILRQAGIVFAVRAPEVEESRRPGEGAAEYVRRLAREKAYAIEDAGGNFVLAADTVVVVDDHVLEKPVSVEDAERMLRALSGQEHVVLTAVCVRQGSRDWNEIAATRVQFVALSEEEARTYARSGEPMDKAGAYAIQGLASKFIDRIEGCYFNVVGLPVALVYRMLKQAGYNFADG